MSSACFISKDEKIPEPGTLDFADWLILNFAAFLKEVQAKTGDKVLHEVGLLAYIHTGKAEEEKDARKGKLFLYGENNKTLDGINGAVAQIVDHEVSCGKPRHLALITVAARIFPTPTFTDDPSQGVTFDHSPN